MTISPIAVPEEALGTPVPWYCVFVLGLVFVCFFIVLLHLPAERLLDLMTLGNKWPVLGPEIREKYLRRVIWVRVILVIALVGSLLVTISALVGGVSK